MFFSSVKEINRLLKEINRWIPNKWIPNIYLEVAIEKKWRTQNFDFLSLKVQSCKLKKALINYRLGVSELSWKFCISTMYNFAIIYP